MERKIDLGYETFSIVNNNFELTSVIINYGGEFYEIEDNFDKLCDVSQMPDYIKDDWIKYNIKELNMIIINKHIEYWEDKQREEVMNTLKSIRRDYIIKGIL